MLHQSDLPPLILPFQGEYHFHLNSEDMYESDLSLVKSRAHGGTMIMWHNSINPYITILPSQSPSFQSTLLKIPGTLSSIHTALYLPTSGKEEQFTACLAELAAHVIDVRSNYPNTPHFLRGDGNVNPNNKVNKFFCSTYLFKSVPLQHPTYHHFVGD